MSIIKENIWYNGEDMNLKINFGAHDNFDGWQQEIDRQTSVVTADSINDVVDEEKRRFKKEGGTGTLRLKFNFWNGATHVPDYNAAGFTDNELDTQTLNVRNSFWIFDYYDSFDSNNQQKIFTQYMTKMGKLPRYPQNSEFNLDGKQDQLYYWQIPLSYLNTITGNTVTGYMKISFFNAKTGAVQLFVNKANSSYYTGQKMFFEATLDVTNMTWLFATSNYPVVEGDELVNSAYVERVNETVDKFDNQKQVPPTGNTFTYNFNDVTYVTT